MSETEADYRPCEISKHLICSFTNMTFFYCAILLIVKINCVIE